MTARWFLVLTLALSLPAIAEAQDTDADCVVLSRVGDRYARAPLPGFDPVSAAAPLSVPKPEGSSALVLCRRDTILPRTMDDRVPREAGLPLALTDGRRVLMLEIVEGRLQASFRRGQAAPGEDAEIKARVDRMQAAVQQPKAP